jgi:gluconate 2-dehydrogenase gamma chain
MAGPTMPRRRFLKGAGAAGTAISSVLAGSVPASEATPSKTQPATPSAAPLSAPIAEPALTLNATELAFIVAAVDTLIPADELTPGGADCGIAVFIDRQLAGAFGSGARLYRDGPFLKGKPEHGYQLALTPREFFRAGIIAANDWTRKTFGKAFDQLAENDRISALQALEQGKADFPGFSCKEFFEALLNLTMEGFFSDPIYGGNRDKIAWKMIGYPGLPATYHDAITKYHGKLYEEPPLSIADFT